MNALAVVLRNPGAIDLARLELTLPTDEDVVVDIEWSGISTGTERLLWSGRMPDFPGMGYPLVPGYESVGCIAEAGARSGRSVGERVFVPGARCFGDVRGLFGGAASRVVVPGSRVLPLAGTWGERGVLLALAATAHHVTAVPGARQPDLIVGHGVLGRMMARLATAAGAAPVVWERNPARRTGGLGYEVIDPALDPRRDYRCICDVSGDPALLDALIAPGPRRRGGAGGLLRHPAVLRVRTGLHARGAPARGGAVAAARPGGRAVAHRNRCRQPGRPDHPSGPGAVCRKRLPHGL